MAKLVFHVDVNSAYLSWEAARKAMGAVCVERECAAMCGWTRKKKSPCWLLASRIAAD